jgi:transposase
MARMRPAKPKCISGADWARTPRSVRLYVEALERRVHALEARLAQLESRLLLDSHNSSRPPSSDRGRRHREPRLCSGRRPGGQPGHPGHYRAPVPAAHVDRRVQVRPHRCHRCHARLRGNDAAPRRHQVVELPPVRAEVTEYILHALACAECGARTRAALPRGVHWRALGPRATAAAGLLTGAYHLSRRTAAGVMADLFDVPLSLGAVAACEGSVSAALAAPVAQVRRAVERSPVAYVDETGWRMGRERRWLWVAATPVLAAFSLHPRRDRAALFATVGAFDRVLVSDRAKASAAWPARSHQWCWAHLRRDLRWLSERPTAGAAAVGADLLVEQRALFEAWYRVRDGTLTRAAFAARAARHRARMRALLERGARLRRDAYARRTCEEILAGLGRAFTFVRVPGVEPTNNRAERALRGAVLWRKGSFGTRSEAGGRYVERTLTATHTLRLQGRNVVTYLTDLMDTHWRKRPLPSLLCQPSLASELAA